MKGNLPIQGNGGQDTQVLLDGLLTTTLSRRGRPCEYPNTPEGLQAFINGTLAYFQYCQKMNASEDLERKLIPDIEGWSAFVGISRGTLWQYRQRGGEWERIIEYYKGISIAIKKQLGLSGKIPSPVFIFDMANNGGYCNTSEFKFNMDNEEEEKKVLTAQALPKLSVGQTEDNIFSE